MKTKLIGIALFALTAAAVVYYPVVQSHTVQVRPPPVVPPLQPEQRPKVEVVFALDTTGSMGGLIQAAKDKIWSIASTMAAAQPAPEIRVGLVAYRDRGDAYVTRTFDLTSDLDSMYAHLIDLRAEGGGDGPESVNQALHDAIHNVSWSRDAGTYRVVFLVGDAPPHMDYQDDVKYPATLAAAARLGITVNTIRCGDNPQTGQTWQHIASLNQGRYFSVAQSGSAIALATPFDAELARLSADLDATRLYYGSEEERRAKDAKVAATEKLHALASPASRARRATFNVSASGEDNLFGDGDLVTDIAAGRVELDAVAPERLPEPLQQLAPAERTAVVRENVERRADLKRQIRALSAQRDSFLADAVEASGAKETSLDHQIFETVREQAGKAGLEYRAAPKY